MLPKRLFKQLSLLKKHTVLLIGFLIILSGLLFLNNYFKIKNIQIINPGKNLSLVGLDLLKNRNLILLDENKTATELVEKNPMIKSVKIRKRYPDKVEVEIKNDKPIAVLKTDRGFLYLSESGKIIEKKKEYNQSFPLINYYQNFYYYQYQAGEPVDFQEIITALYFLTAVTDLGLKVDSVDIAGVYMVAFNLKDKKIIFSLEKKIEDQKYQLATITKEFKIEGRDYVSLDLRFDKPVIKLR